MSSKLSKYVCAALAASAVAGLTVQPAAASSHREAPFITRAPKVDGTDLYMFRSYEVGRSNFVTLVANYQPLQDAYGGPNYFSMDTDALYEIHIDNDGDAKENLTFQFRFTNTNKDTKLTVGGKQVSIPLVINGAGDIVEIKGLPGSTPARDRSEGFREAIARVPTLRIIHDQVANWLREEAMSQMESVAKIVSRQIRGAGSLKKSKE